MIESDKILRGPYLNMTDVSEPTCLFSDEYGINSDKEAYLKELTEDKRYIGSSEVFNFLIEDDHKIQEECLYFQNDTHGYTLKVYTDFYDENYARSNNISYYETVDGKEKEHLCTEYSHGVWFETGLSFLNEKDEGYCLPFPAVQKSISLSKTYEIYSFKPISTIEAISFSSLQSYYSSLDYGMSENEIIIPSYHKYRNGNNWYTDSINVQIKISVTEITFLKL